MTYMHMRKYSLAMAWLALFPSLLLSGCADMPIIAPPPGEDQPIGKASVALGPYLTSADGMQPMFRFVSNRRCVAGIQSLSSDRRYVNRQASFSLFHSLAIPELDSTAPREYRLLLDDLDGGVHRIKGLPRSGSATAIAFAGGKAEPDRLAEAGDMVRGLAPDAVVFPSSPFGGGQPDNASDWETEFFRPLGDKVAMGPMWFAPGNGLPAELFPEHAEEGGYWRRDVGALRIIGIDARAFSFEASRNAALRRLEMDLDPSHAERAWTVVVLSRAAFDARVGDARILQALGDRLEQGGVDLVIGAGDHYLRTRPFAAGTPGQTRYISIADTPRGLPAGLTPREYVAAISGAPHVARLWADEGTLEWQVFDMQGRPIDILTLDAHRRQTETPLGKWDVVADAQAALTLQKEILRLVRQAAKAVPDPGRELLLPLYFANPTTRRFSGSLTWDVQPGSGWRIEPAVMPFDLEPGQGAVARFAVSPGSAASAPTLSATAADVGSASGQLVLTREKRYDVHPAPEAVRIDARLRDKQYWKTLPAMLDFERLDGQTPANPTEARVAADKDGLIVAVSMAARRVSSANPSANDPEQHRDGPVLDDESLEIFIDPDRQGRDYFRFAINPRNVVVDESSRAGIAYNPTWRHMARFGRVDSLETWDVEARIPWEALGLAGPPAPGTEWGFQLSRRDYSAARETAQKRGREKIGPEISQWARADGTNTRPGLYGILRFGDLAEAPSGDGARAAPEPDGLFIRGGQMPVRPTRPLAPTPPPPTPDF